jgi:hypothetical protein
VPATNTSQSFGVIAAAILSYMWVANPNLQDLTLQAAAALFLLFLVIQKFSSGRFARFESRTAPLELLIIITSLYFLISATGGISSIFVPLAYAVLFLSVLTMDMYAVICLVTTLPIFLWATTARMITPHDIATLVSFPALLPILIFAREEFRKAEDRGSALKSSSSQLNETDLFITTFMIPKLQKILEMSDYPDHNKETLQKQLTLLIETAKAMIAETKD